MFAGRRTMRLMRRRFCEAVTRPSMRFVPIRSIDNQAVLMHHKGREILVSQRTQLLNALRGHLAEVGVIAAQGPNGAYALAAAILEGDSSIPLCVRDALAPIVRQLQTLNDEIAASDRAIMGLAKTDETARRLMSVPGIGPITASAIAASVQDVGAFSGPREFAAFLGLAPKQNSSGGKERLGRVSKMGNRYLRKLLVVGAHAVLFHRRSHQDGLRTWAAKLMETKPFKLVEWRWRTGLQGSPSPSCAMALSTGMPWPDRGRPRLSGYISVDIEGDYVVMRKTQALGS
jgi:transposase